MGVNLRSRTIIEQRYTSRFRVAHLSGKLTSLQFYQTVLIRSDLNELFGIVSWEFVGVAVKKIIKFAWVRMQVKHQRHIVFGF